MDQHQKTPEQKYHGNKYRVKSVLLSLSITFFLIILIPLFLYATNSPVLLNLGGVLLLDLTRICFIIVATPIAILTLFVGHRIDDARYNVKQYPLWVELIGLIGGIFLGWTIAAGWSLLIEIANGTIWSDPFLYAPFPIFTALITYLMFKGVQLIYAIKHRSKIKEKFGIPLFFFILSLPVLLYTVMAFISLVGEETMQANSTLTHVKQSSQANKYIISGDITVPQSTLYHITASVGSSPHPTSKWDLRVNGVANFDGLFNFELAKGVNTITYMPNATDCPFTQQPVNKTLVTFTISKVVDGRLIMPNPHHITETILCGE